MKNIIEYPDFDKLDLRIGQIVSATIPKWSEKLIEYRVNFGEEVGERTILSGIKEWYTPEDLIGKSFIFIVNLAERQMGKSISQGMMLMVVPEGGKPILVEVDHNAPIGSVVR